MKRNVAPAASKNQKTWKAFFATSFVVGLLLLVAEIDLYRVTVIDLSVLLCIIAIAGLGGHFLTYKKYRSVYTRQVNLFTSLVGSVVSWGFPACYLFMALNYYILDEKTTYYSFDIQEKSSMPGGKGHRSERQPLVRFKYLGKEKELVFGHSEIEEVRQATAVVLSVRRGFFGYDVICSRSLVN